MSKGRGSVTIPLKELIYQPTVLPSSYPTFLKPVFKAEASQQNHYPLNNSAIKIDGIQVLMNAKGYSSKRLKGEHRLLIKEILLVKSDR